MESRAKRRPRDPDATREVILEAARTLLAKDGPEGISLSEVAHLAGVNRGTAYQHFETREKLIEATVAWASDKLFRAAFGDPETVSERRFEEEDIAAMTERLTAFAMENHELCRVWLLQVLASPDPAQDPFWREYCGSLERWAASDLAVPGIDAEVLSVMNLAGIFLWPIWARAHAENDAGRAALAQRFADETLRLSMYGSLRADAYPGIAERLSRRRK
ncbi:TetR/AcrR family transcriptional regulator [Novosphingobium sp. JCM 18896]|uniref:TetR/AcrR family transcriptional regulator n=1 Tax=Novosphingobium sp. JCM 18896 TaxID=2989731 RepID=UPI00222219B2|nr:TetR/AcrR family transcriptional regulator [Novosphingobium sp. JCM 18896]MCW1431171.1 TetR/AcrR family transcriptional regulator [Novosphingobium sp. JCM 18896]